MEEDHDDRVHSGGLTTITMPKYSPHSGKVTVEASTRYRDGESHREQSGAKSRVAAIVILSYLDYS
jgi:hypothetical protein